MLRLIGDLIPINSGTRSLLGSDPAELCDLAPRPIRALVGRVCLEGSVVDSDTGHVAVPLYVRGEIRLAA